MLGHGSESSPIASFYIDMELCLQNLEDYIYGKRPTPTKAHASLENSGDEGDKVVNTRNIWIILDQIARGVDFIHSRQCVHRDLKPQNSEPLP